MQATLFPDDFSKLDPLRRLQLLEWDDTRNRPQNHNFLPPTYRPHLASCNICQSVSGPYWQIARHTIGHLNGFRFSDPEHYHRHFLFVRSYVLRLRAWECEVRYLDAVAPARKEDKGSDQSGGGAKKDLDNAGETGTEGGHGSCEVTVKGARKGGRKGKRRRRTGVDKGLTGIWAADLPFKKGAEDKEFAKLKRRGVALSCWKVFLELMLVYHKAEGGKGKGGLQATGGMREGIGGLQGEEEREVLERRKREVEVKECTKTLNGHLKAVRIDMRHFECQSGMKMGLKRKFSKVEWETVEELVM